MLSLAWLGNAAVSSWEELEEKRQGTGQELNIPI